MNAAPVYGDGIGVVTHSPGPGLPRFLASLPVASVHPLTVVVVETDEPAGDVGDPLVVRVGEQVARAAAVNRGVVALPAAVGWVCVADPNVEYGPGAIDVLLAAAARFPLAGALGPRLRSASGTVFPSAGALPDRADLRRGRVPSDAPATEGPVGWVSAGCLLLRRAAWDSVDGLDPRHLGPVDSVDLGRRLGAAGWRVVHVPGADVVVGAGPGPGMLESERCGLRRYAEDRR